MRFFFDIRDDLMFTPDAEGLELASLAMAEHEAVKAAAALGADLFPSNVSQLTVTVRDGSRALLEVEVRISKRRLG